MIETIQVVDWCSKSVLCLSMTRAVLLSIDDPWSPESCFAVVYLVGMVCVCVGGGGVGEGCRSGEGGGGGPRQTTLSSWVGQSGRRLAIVIELRGAVFALKLLRLTGVHKQ